MCVFLIITFIKVLASLYPPRGGYADRTPVRFAVAPLAWVQSNDATASCITPFCRHAPFAKLISLSRIGSPRLPGRHFYHPPAPSRGLIVFSCFSLSLFLMFPPGLSRICCNPVRAIAIPIIYFGSPIMRT